MFSRLLNFQHKQPLYLNTLKRLKRSIYPAILMTISEPQQQTTSASGNDLEIKAQQVPQLPEPPKWNRLYTTRSFSSTAPTESQSTVQVIPASQFKSYSLRNRKTTPTATVEVTTATEFVNEAASVATTMAATMETARRSTRSSAQSTTQVIENISTTQSIQYKRPPTLEEYLDRLPIIKLPPHYIVITTKSVEEVDRELAAMISQESVFGLDLEWKPSFRKGVPQSPTGLIQICGATKVLLIQIAHMQGLSEGLKNFFMDHNIYKTGVNIRGDGLKLYRDFKIHTDGLLDLRPIATAALEALPVAPHCYSSKSLRSLTGIFMGVNMPKGRARCSNWNAPTLSPVQVEYAANDAYASYCLYHKLIDATNFTKSDLRPHHLSREAL